MDIQLIHKLYEQEKWRLEKEPEGSAKYLVNPESRIKKWGNFLKRFRNERILDFGCGPGYALYAGRHLNITGADIGGDEIYPKLHKILNVHPVYYDGETLPFKDNSFDVIICHWSLRFAFEGELDWDKRKSELNRVGGHWYVSPREHAKGTNATVFKL